MPHNSRKPLPWYTTFNFPDFYLIVTCHIQVKFGYFGAHLIGQNNAAQFKKTFALVYYL